LQTTLFPEIFTFYVQHYLVSLGTATGMVPDCMGLSD